MKFLTDNIILTLLIILSGGMLLPSMLKKSSNKVSTLQAVQLINQGKIMILDVRHSENFLISHLMGAKNIPLKDLSHHIVELDGLKRKNMNILVVCQSGKQSSKAVRILTDAGFKQVYDLEGGIVALQAQGLPTKY